MRVCILCTYQTFSAFSLSIKSAAWDWGLLRRANTNGETRRCFCSKATAGSSGTQIQTCTRVLLVFTYCVFINYLINYLNKEHDTQPASCRWQNLLCSSNVFSVHTSHSQIEFAFNGYSQLASMDHDLCACARKDMPDSDAGANASHGFAFEFFLVYAVSWRRWLLWCWCLVWVSSGDAFRSNY